MPTRKDIIKSYNLIVGGIDDKASYGEIERAYGGVVRAAKGKMLESITQHLVRIAWQELGQDDSRLSIGKIKTYKIHVKEGYVKSLKDKEVQEYILENLDDHYYRTQVDVHVFVDNRFVLGIECKAYAENAMLKRILVDFMLLKHLHKNLVCCLIQLESQLGGDYSKPLSKVQYGSASTHTLMSFFETVDLNIITILKGERKVDRPIHKPNYFKKLDENLLDATVKKMKRLLFPFCDKQ
ncbi:MAG: restriction endonuclease [Gammaproteobacteria bacterium]|nr:restriction endonuclease [Gammaproteobacteria bacterium]